jgi:hypothetical protein
MLLRFHKWSFTSNTLSGGRLSKLFRTSEPPKSRQRRGCVSIRSIGDELIVQPARQVHLHGALDGDDTLTAAMCQTRTLRHCPVRRVGDNVCVDSEVVGLRVMPRNDSYACHQKRVRFLP